MTTFALGAALFGAMILVPLYYQEVRHESVIATGLLVGPQGLGMLLVMPIAGRLTDRFGGGRVALVGVSILSPEHDPAGVRRREHLDRSRSRLVLLVRGVGIGFSFMPAMTAAFASLRPEQLSDATPQLNVLQRIGGAIGTAVLAVVLQRASGRRTLGHASRARLRHRLLVVARDRRAGADPLPGAAARRAPARAAQPRRPPTPRRPSSRSGPSERRDERTRDRRRGPRRAAERSAELTELGAAFRRVFRSLSRLRGRDTHLGGAELSHAQFELLIELDERGELPAGELAAAARLTPGDRHPDARSPRRLRSRRTGSLGDRPARGRLAADAQGKRKIEAKREAWQSAGSRRSRASTRDELRAATRVLERLGAMFEDASPAEACEA